MCGIIGYIGNKDVTSILIEGLKRLEYRGYDSAGIAFLHDNKCTVVKRKGKVSELENGLSEQKVESTIGIAHTRWATHGEPSEINAHPHINSNNDLFLVHNGIIENYTELKNGLSKKGFTFYSETDTEVLVKLIDNYLQKGSKLFEAVRFALTKVRGTYGIVVGYVNEPDRLIVAKNGSPLVIGLGEGENFIASDINALVAHTSRVVYLEDDEIAVVYKDRFEAKTIHDVKIQKEIEEINTDIEDYSKGEYEHYMLKEIMEQSASVQNSFRGRVLLEDGDSKLGGLQGYEKRIANSKRIILCACGTSWHAALVAEYMIEQFAEIPVEVEYASEFRYRNPIVSPEDTCIFISQSGETADTLAALREAKKHGALVLGVCNVVGSSIARESEAGVYIHAGPEIGVASTKAFTSQLVVFALITVLIGRRRRLSLVDGQDVLKQLLSLPEKIAEILSLNDNIKEIAQEFVNSKNFLYLGRGYNFPVALEGALKLKEISYIHAEGYPAAEMKHGPIALIDDNMPSVFITPQDSVYEKVISNIEEVKARKGRIIAIATKDDLKIDSLVDFTIKVPQTLRMLMPILTVIPLQLLAYHIAVSKGLDVDQPRNLAKSVTVE